MIYIKKEPEAGALIRYHHQPNASFLEKMKRSYSEPKDELEPYVGILRWYIDKKLKQCK